MDIFTIVIYVLAYIIVSDWWLKKVFQIERKEGVIVQYVNNVHKFIEWTLLAIMIIGVIYLLNKGIVAFQWLVSFFFITYFIRCFMLWKYERERKEYILEFNNLIALSVMVIALGITIF